MGLSAAEIGAVVTEIRPTLIGGWIQKIFQPTECAVILEVRRPGRTVLLNMTVQPETARLHIQRGRPTNPARPSSFCQLLRARIQGARIEDIRRHDEDRIVEFQLRTRDSSPVLVAALTGRSANILLTETNGTVLAALRPVRGRSTAGVGLSGQARVRTPDESGRRFFGGQGGEDRGDFPVSRAIEAYYDTREADLIQATIRQQRLVTVRRTFKKLARRVEGLEADLEKARRYHSYARHGELLKANLAGLRKGQSQAAVVDYFDETLPTLSLPLDPAKTPQANMDEYFQKHRKFLTAQREIGPRLATARQELGRAQEEIRALERGEWQPSMESFSASGSRGSAYEPARRANPRGERKGPFRRFQSCDGHPIYVGRNAKENEELTHRFAKSEDLWLHARGVPGSHVVVRLPKGIDAPQDTLRDAATLALLYSDLKKSGKGDVIFTRKKWVKKVKGQAAGTVSVTQDKTIFVQLDRVRLDRLKATSGNEEP